MTLSFQYYTIAYDNSDELEYIVEYDNGTTWGTSTALNKNTAAWTEVSIAIPNGTPYVRLAFRPIRMAAATTPASTTCSLPAHLSAA
jgi:hypothetical protein